jgi:N-acetylglutamate synthase-like GNAT family acetyltransferase
MSSPVADIAVAPFAADDHAQIVHLITTIQQKEFLIPVTYADQPDLHDIQAFYRRGVGEFWVARHADTVVGTIALVGIGNGQGALRKMFVDRNWRGAARGDVAGRLLGALKHFAVEHGIDELFLGTTDKFAAAHRFYRKNGFAEISAAELPAAFPRMHVDTMFFRRRERR